MLQAATLRSANPVDAIWTTGKGNAAKLTDHMFDEAASVFLTRSL